MCRDAWGPKSSITLKSTMERAMTTDWPTSTPLMPARMLMALVQNTASMPMYTKYSRSGGGVVKGVVTMRTKQRKIGGVVKGVATWGVWSVGVVKWLSWDKGDLEKGVVIMNQRRSGEGVVKGVVIAARDLKSSKARTEC